MRLSMMFALLALVSADLRAEGWTGTGEIGLAVSRGNSKSETLNAKLGVIKETERWKHTGGLQVLRVKGEVDDDFELTANRYELTGNSAYSFNPKSYAIGAIRYENDDFAPFEYQGILSLSYGYKVIDRQATSLSLEAGPGFRRAKDRITGEEDSSAVARGKVDYRHVITETTELTNGLLVEAGSDNTFVQNEIGVAVKINASLALKTALQVRYNSEAEPGVDSTDTLFTTNLVFGFPGH